MKLYTVVEAVPSRVIGLLNFLVTTDGRDYARAELLELLQPASVRKGADADPDMANKVIGAALELGAVRDAETSRGEPTIRPIEGLSLPTGVAARELLRRWVAKRILHDLAEGEGRELAAVFAWFMTLRLRDVPASRARWKERFEADGFDIQRYGLKNDARWDNLFDWARFIGLIWHTRADRDTPGVIPNPAALLQRFLPDIFGQSTKLTADEFRTELATLFHALDGGRLFEEVRAQVISNRGETAEHGDRLSPAIGYALRELAQRGIVEFGWVDDQRKFLLLDDGEKIGFVKLKASGVA